VFKKFGHFIFHRRYTVNDLPTHSALSQARDENEKTLDNLREALRKFREACRKLEAQIK
jgi:hypothetical protein